MDKIAVIGLGPMGLRHIQAIIKLENEVELVGVVDLRESVVKQLITDYNLTESVGYSDYKVLLEKCKPDILVIATNGPSHYPIFLDAVKAGVKKIFCEKPIATSLQEAKEMIRIAKDQGIKLLVNHSRRWSSDYARLKSSLHDGIIGSLESVTITMGGGQLACNGTHMVDLVSYLTDQPLANVIGFLNDEGVRNPRGEQFKDPGGYGIFHYQDGTRLYLEMTDDLGIPPMIVLNGRFGRIRIDEINRWYEVESRTEADRTLPITRYGISLSQKTTVAYDDLDIIQLCAKGIKSLVQGEALASAESAVHSLEAIIALHYSHRLGHQIVNLPLEHSTILEQKFQFT